LGADAAIIMFDISDRVSFQKLPDYFKLIEKMCGSLPACLVANKVDKVRHRKVKEAEIRIHRQYSAPLFHISSLTNHQIEKPIEWLVQALLKDPSAEVLLPDSTPPTADAEGYSQNDHPPTAANPVSLLPGSGVKESGAYVHQGGIYIANVNDLPRN
jgi:GTPase SAR1 family protein